MFLQKFAFIKGKPFPVFNDVLFDRGSSWCRHVYFMQNVVRCCQTTSPTDNKQSVEDCSSENVSVYRGVDRTAEESFRRYLLKPDQPPDAKILRVAILGGANAGKSTFINTLMKWKVNSVSSKVHTTRKNTNTMMTEGSTQIVFVDTPGVITLKEKRKHFVDGSVLTDPEQSLHEVDVVGIIVDAANRWTRNQLHPEILKVLHLHKHLPSFLILNKIDSVNKRFVLLETAQSLTEGIIAGKTFSANRYKLLKKKKAELEFSELEKKYGKLKLQTDNVANRKFGVSGVSDTDDGNERLFSKLENKYGRLNVNIDNRTENNTGIGVTVADGTISLRHKVIVDDVSDDGVDIGLYDGVDKYLNQFQRTKAEDADIDSEPALNTKTDNVINGSKRKISKEAKVLSNFEENGNNLNFEDDSQFETRIKFQKTIEKEHIKQAEILNNKDMASQKEVISNQEQGLDSNVNDFGIKIVDNSYQSEFLNIIQSKQCPELISQSDIVKESISEEEDLDWTDKVSRIKEAIEAAKNKHGWNGFERVFTISALQDIGVEDVKDYLLELARPGDWLFHSSLVTSQHPAEIVKLCLRQALLDHLSGSLPYTVEPEIVYWDIDSNDRLNVAVEIPVKNNSELNMIVGDNGKTTKAVAASTRQAIMDAFHCDVMFKIVIKVKRRR